MKGFGCLLFAFCSLLGIVLILAGLYIAAAHFGWQLPAWW